MGKGAEAIKVRSMVRVAAGCSHHKLHGIKVSISGLKKAGINYKKIPQYCTVEIDINSFKPRVKGEKL